MVNTVTIPSEPTVYLEKGGKRWSRDGAPINPAYSDKPASYGLNNIISLRPESALLLKISSSTPGDIVISVPGNYNESLREEARKSQVWLWSGTIRITR